jgi:hypothetical protein
MVVLLTAAAQGVKEFDPDHHPVSLAPIYNLIEPPIHKNPL